MKRSILIFALLVSCTGVNSYKSYALINDVTAPSTKYELIMIDGGKVNRRQHSSYVTIVPYAIVEPGSHTFKFKERRLSVIQNEPRANYKEISVTVEAGKLYNVKIQNEVLVLDEDLTYKK